LHAVLPELGAKLIAESFEIVPMVYVLRALGQAKKVSLTVTSALHNCFN
jgi:hypothetical protein